ncbi:hypothetical protein IMG5_148100 [Ichthyophthirius multifiliis]|uniref:Transmembrane protein n=1 Tax=Ichthyophthirius multifiliis TaxID=5932 RepID=G0QY87_ICHMU|nr:hypothetical protein IMG5_148100 [Ichthyophthirius multifiliis]EGR29826.1 hypothetical protein IMG5_148100 [Ichthyophthirius multifiliis]|eukprot:XP_004031062.1 hypothetical protein IMG5_148100 [Ichthyophthirius multifiliis]
MSSNSPKVEKSTSQFNGNGNENFLFLSQKKAHRKIKLAECQQSNNPISSNQFESEELNKNNNIIDINNDNTDDNNKKNVFQKFFSQIIEKYSKLSPQNKKILFLTSGVFIIIFIILIGLGIGGVLSSSSSSSSSHDQLKYIKPNDAIKVPQSFSKFEKLINSGQESNIVQIIHVPKSQKNYEYKLVNDQTTISGDNKTQKERQVITHTFALLCAGVDNEAFDMYLYFKNTVKEENGVVTSKLTGFPDMIEKEKTATRNMVAQQNTQQSQDQQASQQQNDEYGPLTAEEISILSSKGITETQYIRSRYPIIRFKISKQGKPFKFFIPLNLRYDLQKIYMNIIEQLAPLVSSDIYNVVKDDPETGKKRILKERSKEYSYRSLNDEIIKPKLEATIKENGENVLTSEETEEKVGKTNTVSTSIIVNGSLLESKQTTTFIITDDSAKNGGQTPLFNSIEQKAEVIIKFISQDDAIDDKLYNQVTFYQQSMSVLQLSYDDAFLLNKSKNTATPADSETQRLLNEQKAEDEKPALEKDQPQQPPKPMGEVIDKPIFRQKFASVEFGANIKSECIESGFIASTDVCTVGIYGYFDGQLTKIIERQTRINVSKLLKYYQYVQHALSGKVGSLVDNIQGRVDEIFISLNAIIDKAEQLLDIKQNPILKEIVPFIDQDQLNIMAKITNVETLINSQIKNINKIVSDPLSFFKDKILSFLQKKQISIESQVTNLKNFYNDKLKKIYDYIVKYKLTGISQQIQNQIKIFLSNYESILFQLIEEPAKKLLDEVQKFLLQKGNELFSKVSEVDKLVSSKTESIVQQSMDKVKATAEEIKKKSQIPNQIKKMLSSQFILDYLREFIKKAIQKITSQFDITKMLTEGLKQFLQVGKNKILMEMENIKTTVNEKAEKANNEEIQVLFEEINNVVSFSTDLYSGLKELKNDVNQIIQSLKKIQGTEVIGMVKGLTQQVVDLPKEILGKLKEQGKEVLNKLKSLGGKIKENLIDWKNEIFQISKSLLKNIKGIYDDIRDFFKKPQFPKNDENYYKEPIFSEVKDLVGRIKGVFTDTKFTRVTAIYERFKTFPQRFFDFVAQLKEFGMNQFKYWDQLKLSISNVKDESNLLWINIKQSAFKIRDYFKSFYQKVLSLTGYGSKGRLLNDEIPVADFSGKGNDDLPDLQGLQTEFGDSFQQALASAQDLVKDGIGKAQEYVNDFKEQVVQQADTTGTSYKELIAQLIKKFNIEKSFPFPNYTQKVEYNFNYKIKIGLEFQITLYAQWQLGFNFKVSVKNAILDLTAGANTRVEVKGSIKLDCGYGQVGGSAEGVLLDTSITFGLSLRPLEKFKGSLYIDGYFNAYDFTLNAYLTILNQKESVNCQEKRLLAKETAKKAVVDQKNKNTEKSLVKSSIQNIVNSKAPPIVKKVVGKEDPCKTVINSEPQKTNLLGPIELKGKVYKERIYEVSW